LGNANFGFGTPFQEQIDYLVQKLNLPTEKSDDIKGRAHDKAFIVAGAAKADLIEDLHQAMNKAAADGRGLNGFQNNFKEIVSKNGWTGWTGEGSAAGEAWRARIIYQTNMLTSYWAGRYQQMTNPGVLKLHPYWRYIHSENVMHPREEHVAWHGLTLLASHPFWKTHFAPNGYGCMCRITSVTRKEGESSARAGLGEPPPGWDQIDPKTGEQIGIGKGFGYAPGVSVNKPMQEFIDAKLINLDAPIGAAMWEALKPVLAMERQLAWWETLDGWLADTYPRGKVAVVGTMDEGVIDWLATNGKPAPLSAEIGIRDNLPRGTKQARHIADQNALTLEEWRSLPSLFEEPPAIYFDTGSGKLMYVADGLGPMKLALEFDPVKLKKTDVNVIESAFHVSDETIAGDVKGGVWKVIRISGASGGSRTHISGK
jgi:hypothetical protein